MRELLSDPANDDRPYAELAGEAWRYGAAELAERLTPAGIAHRNALGFDDAEAIACEQTGFARQILSPAPLEIRQYEDHVELRYEEWGVVRIVHTDGRRHPAQLAPSRHGHSVGRYERGALLIETSGVEPSSFQTIHGGGGHSDQLRTLERYTRSGDGAWLRLEVVFEDPVMLQEPLVYEKVWRSTPGVEFFEHGCDAISGRP